MGFVIDKKPIKVERGKGVYVYDDKNTEYLDFGASYAVTVTGHNHPRVIEATKKQMEKLTYIQSSYPNSTRKRFEEKLSQIGPGSLSNIWLCNSGSEANEAALKFARSSTGSSKIIAAKRGFHGRTIGSLSATWKRKYRKPFEPLIDVEFVNFNDLEDLKKTVDDETAAVILEPIQGEGGIYKGSKEFLKLARELTADHEAALIFDEIQTGLGRTGSMWRCESLEIEPDILTSAKGLAGGMPIGALICKDWISERSGPHGSTFSGSPVVTAAADETLSVIKDEKLPENAAEVGEYLLSELEELEENYSMIRDVRGEGLMAAIEVRKNANRMLKELAMEHNVLALPTGRTVLRILPPLIVDQTHVDQFVEAVSEVIGNE